MRIFAFSPAAAKPSFTRRGKQVCSARVVLKVARVGREQGCGVSRLFAEARAAAHFDHPNIVPIYDAGEAEGIRFISMAYVPGMSLDRQLRKGSWAVPSCAQLVRDVASALHYAHARGVIHRDVKPGNILVDLDGRPRLCDFGLAKLTRTDVFDSTKAEIVGAPAYTSPEQLEGPPEFVGPRSDIYSLGAVLYFLLTGRPPSQSAATVRTMKGGARGAIISATELNATVDRKLATICHRCLATKPQRRYPSAERLAADLDRWLIGVN